MSVISFGPEWHEALVGGPPDRHVPHSERHHPYADPRRPSKAPFAHDDDADEPWDGGLRGAQSAPAPYVTEPGTPMRGAAALPRSFSDLAAETETMEDDNAPIVTVENQRGQSVSLTVTTFDYNSPGASVISVRYDGDAFEVTLGELMAELTTITQEFLGTVAVVGPPPAVPGQLTRLQRFRNAFLGDTREDRVLTATAIGASCILLTGHYVLKYQNSVWQQFIDPANGGAAINPDTGVYWTTPGFNATTGFPLPHVSVVPPWLGDPEQNWPIVGHIFNGLGGYIARNFEPWVTTTRELVRTAGNILVAHCGREDGASESCVGVAQYLYQLAGSGINFVGELGKLYAYRLLFSTAASATRVSRLITGIYQALGILPADTETPRLEPSQAGNAAAVHEPRPARGQRPVSPPPFRPPAETPGQRLVRERRERQAIQ